jgi:isopentenyl phosphate kinase
MLLIKLGGSVITDKAKPLTPRVEDIKRLTKEIASVEEKKIIVHGAGSFGHIKAAEYELSTGFKNISQSEGISLVQCDMRVLNQMLVDAFHEAGVPVASIPAGAITTFDSGQMADFPSDVFAHYLEIGITPITFGDVVVDRSQGVAICSGDDIMMRLAADLKVSRCIFVTAVDGIFARYPPEQGEKPLPIVGPNTRVEFKTTDTDVTGSMEKKLAIMIQMTSLGCTVEVINGLVPDRLRSALANEDYLGTRVRGD